MGLPEALGTGGTANFNFYISMLVIKPIIRE